MISHTTRVWRLSTRQDFYGHSALGLLGGLLGIYLYSSGLSSTAIGFIIAKGLNGSAYATIVTSIAS